MTTVNVPVWMGERLSAMWGTISYYWLLRERESVFSRAELPIGYSIPSNQTEILKGFGGIYIRRGNGFEIE